MNYSLAANRPEVCDGKQVTICDINEHMLKVGEQRATDQGLTAGEFQRRLHTICKALA